MTTFRCPAENLESWTLRDIFEIACPYCGNQMEFFKDDPFLTCSRCRKEVNNPRISIGCTEWCIFSERCSDKVAVTANCNDTLRTELIAKMKAVLGDDKKLIDHSLRVLDYAEAILRTEKGVSPLIVRAAALLHDIGKHEAERKYGSTAGKYQEIEGPPIARRILEELGVKPRITESVCEIIAHHHSVMDLDTPEFRVVWDADWLVNIPEAFDLWDRENVKRLIAKVFKTEGGRVLGCKVL
jgi:putative nucleotidyltransferase with HDIG domain